MNRLLLRQPSALISSLISQLNATRIRARRWISIPIWSLLGNGRPIRTALLQLAVIPLTLVLILLGFAINHVVKNQIETEQGEKLRAQAAYFTKNIDQAIDRHLVDIKSRAALLPKFNLHSDYPRLQSWMLTVQSQVTDYTWIGFADRNGIVRVSTQAETSLQSVGQMPWFQESLRRAVVMDSANAKPPFTSKVQAITQPRAIYLAAPVYGERGEVVGVLIGYLDWDWIVHQHADVAKQLAMGQQEDIFVVATNGEALRISKDAHKIKLRESTRFQLAQHQSSRWQREGWPDDKEYLTGYAKSGRQYSAENSGWTTAVRLPLDHVYTNINPLLTGLWLIIITAIIGFVAMSSLLLRITLRPIEILVNTINTVTERGGTVPTVRPTPREFQILTKAVNRMIQAIRDRETANQAKTRLLADMSHEIRTPLHGLIGHAELLKDRLADPQDQADMHRLIACAKEMTALVNDALDLSAIELKKLRLKPQPVLLKELVDFNVEVFRSVATQQGLFFDLEFCADPELRLFADRLRLGQILRNLFSNAVKFTLKGGVRVVIRADQNLTDLNGNSQQDILLTLKVSDSGIGISHDERSKLFSRYHQAYTTPDTGDINPLKIGTGLGLYVTQELVTSMGGHIRLESEPGLGTCVHVEIPLPIIHEDRPAGATVQNSNTPETHRPTLRVLLVEDAPENREVMQRWLAQQGHEVVSADSGQRGLQLVNQQIFDLILLDIDLPDMDGRAIAQSIREGQHENSRATIFALSGHAFQQDHESSLNAGFDLHIDKPLDFGLFKDQLGLVERNTFESA